MKIYAFWNNKGGTGKTSLLFQAATMYAEQHASERVLVLDLCPQANISELLFGGMTGNGSSTLAACQSETPRRTAGGYFESRLPLPYSAPTIDAGSYLSTPSQHNPAIPANIKLLAGDPLLELQSNPIATLANNNIPGINPWLSVVDWIKDFIEAVSSEFETVFIDTNPSFSMYTQIALSAGTRLVLPTMADDSSRRAIQNAFTLIHGLGVPSPIYADHAFTTRLRDAERDLPRIHLIPKNRLTQYMGPASAYSSVMGEIEQFVGQVLQSNPEVFTFASLQDGFVDIRDFQTTGVVAFAEGTPFSRLRTGIHDLGGREVQVNAKYLENCREAMQGLVARL